MTEICNRNCKGCSHLNINTDNNGYPWGYDCLKYGDSVLMTEFENTKKFEIEGNDLT